jgi:hypothetical protein
VEVSCEHGNEPSGFINILEILEWLSDWRLLKKGVAPWSYYEETKETKSICL